MEEGKEVLSASGRVEAITEKPSRTGKLRYGILMGGDWFNGWGQCPVRKGQEITLLFTENGKWKDVEEIKGVEGEGAGAGEEIAGAVMPSATRGQAPEPQPFDWAKVVDRRLEIIKYALEKLDALYPVMEMELKKDIAVSISIDVSKKENIETVRRERGR